MQYRGGTQITIRTTSGTLEQRKNCIPLSDFPETFRDAVILTRKLGVRYLWIDCLCIIQGSNEDWDFEVTRMGNVYRGSLLTIAARNSASSNDGLLKPRELPKSVRLKYQSASNSKLVGSMYIRPSFNDFETVDQINTEAHLDQRGWVYQEHMLSVRTLICGAQSSQWDCFETYQTESLRLMDVPYSNPKLHVLKSYFANPSTLDPYTVWLEMVEAYSRRRLTFQSDKLAAIEGLASIIGDITTDRYHAGMWRKDMLRFLLWGPAYPERTVFTDNGSPSWSWTSIADEVICQREPLIVSAGPHSAKVIDITTVLVGVNPMGAVSGGCLRVDALQRWIDIGDGLFKKYKDWQYTIHLDVDDEGSSAVRSRTRVETQKFLIIQLISGVDPEDVFQKWRYFGLVSEQTRDGNSERYKRVGLVTGFGGDLTGWTRGGIDII